jgi:hypothetical protein
LWQRSSRVDVLFLLAVESLRRVRYRSSRVAVASHRDLGAAAEVLGNTFSGGFVFLRVYY